MAGNEADVKGFVKRFQGRADVYSKHRPSYPIGVLLTLRREIGFDRERVVADIGSGTGILSELFLEGGNRVYCVEPNEDMRKAAEEKLRRYAPRYISVDGTAEATNLQGGSIDLVAAGQALHWFDVEKARAEFARIPRRGDMSLLSTTTERERAESRKRMEG
jgi:ubiquinone/menaquinone biosynthesis C-methylase UbiE